MSNLFKQVADCVGIYSSNIASSIYNKHLLCFRLIVNKL